jgi:hypothetical protein
VKVEECYCEQTKKGIYFNRAFGGDSYHCIIDGDIDAGFAAGKKTGKIGCL